MAGTVKQITMEEKFKFLTPGLFRGVTAGEAAAELKRIREKHGTLHPEDVVEESREDGAVLHNCFQWDDTKAAELYRRQQARSLIGNIVVMVENEDVKCSVRAFVNVRQDVNAERSYAPINEAILNGVAYKDLLKQAKDEMISFCTKYRQIEELNGVKAAMMRAVSGVE